MYIVSIHAGAQVAIILLACGPYVVIVDYWDRFCTLGRAPRTKETLPDFHEWCRVTRHPRIFRRLTGCQRTLGFGASQKVVVDPAFFVIMRFTLKKCETRFFYFLKNHF